MGQEVKVLAEKNSRLSIEDLKVFDEDAYFILRDAGINNLNDLNNFLTLSGAKLVNIGEIRLKRLNYYLSSKMEQPKHCRTSEEVALYNILKFIDMPRGYLRVTSIHPEFTFSPIENYYSPTRKAILRLNDYYQQSIKLRFFKNRSIGEIRCELNNCSITINTYRDITRLILLQLRGKYVAEWVGNVTKDNHIEDLGYFSGTASRELFKLGITTFEQLLTLSDEQLLALPKIGPARLANIQQYIKEKKKVLGQI